MLTDISNTQLWQQNFLFCIIFLHAVSTFLQVEGKNVASKWLNESTDEKWDDVWSPQVFI